MKILIQAKAILALAFIFLGVDSNAQIDSIQRMLLIKKADSIHAYTRTIMHDSVQVAFENFTLSEKIFRENQAWGKQVKSLLGLTNVANLKDNPIVLDSMIELTLKQAEDKLESDHFLFPYIFANYATKNRLEGDLESAIKYGKKAIKSLKGAELNSKYYYYETLAHIYIDKGKYNAAQECMEIFFSNNKDEWLTKSPSLFYTSGLIHKKNGDLANAIDKITKSVEFGKPLVPKELSYHHLSNFQINLIDVLLLDGKFISAKKNIDELENYPIEFVGKRKAELLYLKALYHYKTNTKDQGEIISMLKESNKLFYSSLLNSGNERIIKNNQLVAEVYRDEGNLAAAKQYYQSSLDSLNSTKYLDNPIEIQYKALSLNILDELLSISINENDHKSAGLLIDRIIGLIDVFRLENYNSSHKTFWATTNLRIIEKAAAYLVSQKEYAKAFELIEKNKSNLLANNLKLGDDRGFTNISDSLLLKEKELRNEIKSKKKLIKDALENNPKSEAVLNQKEILTNLGFQLESIISKIEKDNPQYYKLKYDVSNLSYEYVKKNLKPSTVVFEYFIGIENAFLFAISSKDIKVYELHEFESLRGDILTYYNMIKDPSSSIEAMNDLRSKLTDALLNDALSELGNEVREIVFVPDDILNNMPFDLLGNFIENPNENSLVTYNQYSLKLWNMLQDNTASDKTYDFVGYAYDSGNTNYVAERSCLDIGSTNLVCSQEELNIIEKAIPNKEALLLNQSMRALLEKANDTKILHLATHACVDASNNEFSRIYFNDDHLSNVDLRLKDINADLVVLSACETGFGKVIKGEGTMSIAKGFFHAGAKSAVVSLWPVDDCTTSELMAYFYKELNAGSTKDVALNTAKKEYLQKAHHSRKHPYYWAGFVLIGDNAAIWPLSNKWPYLIGFSIIILIGLLLYKNMKVKA